MGALLAAPVAPPRVAAGRVFSREPDPAWVRDLRAYSPRSATHSWLYLAWEPGDWWDPIERWMLYQVTPAARVDPFHLAELRGPPPRSTGHFCAPGTHCGHQRRLPTWVGGCCHLITTSQWRLFRATGGLARPYWVVQGDQGGHLRFYTESQTALAELAGLPPHPPAPGALPYAEPDQRTWAGLRSYDRLLAHRPLLERTVDDLAREDRDAGIAVRRAMLDTLAQSSREAVDVLTRSWHTAMAKERLASWCYADDPAPDYEQDEDDFLNDVE